MCFGRAVPDNTDNPTSVQVHTTGAVRLEDPRGGAVWLQVANKSMLMNQKIGQRLADDCKSEEQTRVAEAMKHAPPPSLLSGTPAGSVKP